MKDSKREKKLRYLVIGYANAKTFEESKRQWKEVKEYFDSEISKAKEEGRQDIIQMLKDRNTLAKMIKEGKLKVKKQDMKTATAISFR